MSLFSRITDEDQTLAVHTFMAVMGELQRGQISNAQALAAFDPPLTPTEQNQALAIKGNLGVSYDRDELHDVLLMVERGIAPYDVEGNVKTRLGF